jgi:eukaryotic-like serine/threonine-protein kinase
MVGEVISGRYELEELVEHGGMSSVYRAYDRMLERNVAIKVLHAQLHDDPEYVERFRREARAVAQLSHPHIVTVIDRGVSDDRQFIVFEFVDGENLKQLLERTGRLPIRRVLELAVQTADALAFAHTHGIVHRDVKPQNILLDPAGEVKVTDFGIARTLDVDRQVTQTGTVLGTSNYLSPEQAEGAPVGPASDVYSLGVVLYELLTGEVPFRGDSLVVVAMKHVTEDAPDVRARRPEVAPCLAAAVERALAKQPELRFASMDAFATELRRCLDELGDFDADRTMIRGAATVREVPPRVHVRRRRPVRMTLLLALAGVIVLAVVAGLLLSGGDSPLRRHHPSGTSGSTVVHLRGVGDYDPQGDGSEHSYTAGNATDGNPSTYWNTEKYATPQFGGLKSGLGLVVDAGKAVKLSRLTVHTTTGGFTARILAGNSSTGGFSPDSASQLVSDGTTFTLEGKTAQYYVLWISMLPPRRYVFVNEVTAR